MARPQTELSRLTTMGVGGPAEMLVSPTGPGDLRRALDHAGQRDLPVLVLGGGSNIVVADGGVKACIVHPTAAKIEFQQAGNTVIATVDAGCDWDEFVRAAVLQNLQGIECLSGIPGQVGATPIQNVGAYGQEVSETIQRVHTIHLESGRGVEFESRDCQFGYRDSFFKRAGAGKYLVTGVSFRLQLGGVPRLKYAELKSRFTDATPGLSEVRTAVLELRREKSMLRSPEDENGRSCGSFFVNVQLPEADTERIERAAGVPPPRFPAGPGRVKVPAAWLIEKAGFKRGLRRGPVGLSTKHSLCLVAHEGATAAHIVALAWEIRRRVEDVFEVTLVPEPQFWGFDELDRGLPIQTPAIVAR